MEDEIQTAYCTSNSSKNAIRGIQQSRRGTTRAAQEERGAFYGGYIEDNFNPCGPHSLRASNLSRRYFILINRRFFPGDLWWLNIESGLG
ncbi:MAG: hypothetical protein CMN04_10610 [Roseibacillus sp.]|nr:hypothetical protein [Roseibacillus sp.]